MSANRAACGLRNTAAYAMTAFLASFPAVALAAETSERQPAASGDPMLVWKVANFLLLVGIAGYFLYKKGGAFFTGRTAQIQRELLEAEKVRKDAEARCAEIERRLGNLASEVAGLRAQARQEFDAEGGRARAETEKHSIKIAAQADQDVLTAAKVARQQLRAHAAGLAVELAAAAIRQRITPEVNDALVTSSIAGLENRASGRKPEVA